MPSQKAMIFTLKTPADANGERKDLFPRTTAEAIRYVTKNGIEMNLSDFVQQHVEDGGATGGGATSEDIPLVSRTTPDHACLWARVITEETNS